jgi:hypothetical protein
MPSRDMPTKVFDFCFKRSLISFKSSRQRRKTKSRYEAEILSFCEATHTSMRLRNYQTSLGLVPTSPARIFVDNDPVIQYTNQVSIPRPSRHVTQSYHYGRDQRLAGHITVHPIASAENPVDFMTKALPVAAHLSQRSPCGICFAPDAPDTTSYITKGGLW